MTAWCRAEGCFAPVRFESAFDQASELPCPRCGSAVRLGASPALAAGTGFAPCAACGCAALFSQKDVDQRLGCAVMAAGIATALVLWWKVHVALFVPALLAFVLVDRLIRHRVPEVVICYRCDAEYRGFPRTADVRPYDAHVGERYSEERFERGKR